MKKSIILLAFAVFIQQSYAQEALNETYDLMPWPQEVTLDNPSYRIDSDLTISVLGNDQGKVSKAAVNFLRRLSNRTGVFIDEGFPVDNDKGASIEVLFDDVSNLTLGQDESYVLEIDTDKILIKAKTDVGALYGLQTLLQSVAYDEDGYYFPGLTISDAPRFVWRGLMIDVARHFEPVGY